MRKKEFVSQYGDVKQEVSKDYVTRTISTHYNIEDAITEICDNSIDARLENSVVNVSIETEDNRLIIKDDGSGVKNHSDLFKLGGTTKIESNSDIGKFGEGLKGAFGIISKECRINMNEGNVMTCVSYRDGIEKETKALIDENYNFIIGKTIEKPCKKNMHGTTITFENASIENIRTKIINHLKAKYEYSFSHVVNIKFNGKDIGANVIPTFNKNEIGDEINVCDFTVIVRYKLLQEKSDKSLSDSGIKFIDMTTGRLIAQDIRYWKWFADRQIQQIACGLRVEILIPSTIDAYRVFNIKSSKNDIVYRAYYNQDGFEKLTETLQKIYASVSRFKDSKFNDKVIEIDDYQYRLLPTKVNGGINKISDKSYVINKNFKDTDVLRYITNILKEIERLNKIVAVKTKKEEKKVKYYSGSELKLALVNS